MADDHAHGLTHRQLETIRSAIAACAKGIERVALFGSRAQGKQRPNSDVDLVLYGDLDQTTASRITALLEESSLPFKVDVLVYQLIEKPELKRHIDLVAVDLFRQEQLKPQTQRHH